MSRKDQLFGQPPLEQHEREAVTRDMILRDPVPAAMLDRHPRCIAQRFEAQSSSVDWPGANVAWRHVSTSRSPGCQTVMRPDLEFCSVHQ
jgi:hypothetical protein